MTSNYSAVIRTKNSAETILSTLNSILSQTLPPKRIFLVDNGSTDTTLTIARELCGDLLSIVYYPTDEPFNYGKAVNLGLQKVETPQTLIISSHVTLLSAELLEKASNYLSTESHTASVAFPRNSNEEVESIRFKLGHRNSVSNSAQLIKTSYWEDCKFSETIPTAEDRLWEYTLRDQGVLFAISNPAVSYKNPYHNTEKLVQEAYVMAKFIDTPTTLTSRLKKDLKALAKNLVLLKFENLKKILRLIQARLCGFFIGKKAYESSSYRKETNHG